MVLHSDHLEELIAFCFGHLTQNVVVERLVGGIPCGVDGGQVGELRCPIGGIELRKSEFLVVQVTEVHITVIGMKRYG